MTAMTLSLLMLVQSIRRFYECFCVSIFNEATRMSIVHYVAGFAFYTGVALSILEISPNNETSTTVMKDVKNVTFLQATGVTMFVWASWHQNKAHRTLANLRKDRKGTLISFVAVDPLHSPS